MAKTMTGEPASGAAPSAGMAETTPAASRGALRAGRFISGFVVVFLLGASALPKLMGHASATEPMAGFGFPEGYTFWIGVLEATCAVLYAIPRIAVLGAVILTGYLGGAIVTQLRVEDPWFLFPAAIALLAWLGIYLREDRLSTVLPVRK